MVQVPVQMESNKAINFKYLITSYLRNIKCIVYMLNTVTSIACM